MKLRPNLRIGETIRSLARFTRHYFKEIAIALVLALVAAVVLEKYEHKLHFDAMRRNLNAVAALYAYDAKGKAIGQGSGVFITPTGVLATNYHVVKGASNIIAQLPSGAFYALRGIRDIDERADVAILQFDARVTPAVDRLGDSTTLQVGDEVYAIGTPATLRDTVSTGNVSNPLQEIGGRRFIQFTAPISPGSSGGGLFNTDGEVVGITAEIYNISSGAQVGQAQNLNLAVPINDLKDVLSGGVNALAKESPAYYYSLGNLADNKKQWDTAIKYYQQALAIDDKYVDAYLGVGSDYYEKGQFDLEVASYLQATLLDPQNAYALYYLGTAYEDTGQYADAMAAYKRALAIDPDYKDALHDLSILYLVEGNAAAARELLPTLIATDRGWGKELEILLRRIR